MHDDHNIHEVSAKILINVAHPAMQHVMRLHAPAIAKTAQPGQFVHIQVAKGPYLRRPISLMLCDPIKGTIDILFKVVGEGTRLLAAKKAGEALQLCGPIGVAFSITDTSRRYLCIGGGVGIPPMIFAADRIVAAGARPIVFAGSEVPFPFALASSNFLLPGIPAQAMMTIQSLEARNIPCRLASNNSELFGCHAGYVADLAALWLAALPPQALQEVTILSCGPFPMLQAVAALGLRFDVPTFVSLEEYMACGIGACAGCVVETHEHDGTHYRRVCVDGPVFDATVLRW
ncbi:MAG: dihydroorotate dehydrogenase electron transfer subunit [Mariprofundaceae bacterium]|nr:dihydroorotate dehydrogenase electron transfer subunit [Mariprofundaceae bacterium]